MNAKLEARKLKARVDRATAPVVSHSELLNHVRYDPDTGKFTFAVDVGKRYKAGQEMGCVQTNGYVRIAVNKRQYFAHRLAWFYVHGEWPSVDVDHINRNRADNRLCNLRLATRSQNMRNSTNLGVHFSNTRNRWVATIGVNSKQIYLGSFDTLFDAVCARRSAELKYAF